MIITVKFLNTNCGTMSEENSDSILKVKRFSKKKVVKLLTQVGSVLHR